MSSPSYRLLRYLRELAELHGLDDPASGATIRMLAQVTQVDESDCVPLIREMQARGLVRREPSGTGWSRDVVFVTADGLEAS